MPWNWSTLSKNKLVKVLCNFTHNIVYLSPYPTKPGVEPRIECCASKDNKQITTVNVDALEMLNSIHR